ncbi:MAG: hypothetical protein AAGF26_08370 [Cyanobacteria bacterium P01_G01_bin.49]
MDDIKVKAWMTPLDIDEARFMVGEIIDVIVGGDLRFPTPMLELFRFARVRSVHERTDTERVCKHCGESAKIMLNVEWEADDTESRANEVCEHCIFGRVTEGGDAVSFASRI